MKILMILFLFVNEPAQYEIEQMWVNGEEYHFEKCSVVDTYTFFGLMVDEKREMMYYDKRVNNTRIGCYQDMPFVVEIKENIITLSHAGVIVKFLIKRKKEYKDYYNEPSNGY